MKPNSHKKLTELAITVCEERLPLSLQNPRNQKEVIQGTADEDTKDLVDRVTNWHFYRAENSPIPEKVRSIFKTTSEDILRKRIKAFLSGEKGTAKHLNLLGRIVHHIQDMSTPSHVMPIYHGPKFPLYLSVGKIDDYFENFLEDHLDYIKVDDSIKNDISPDNMNSFEDLYHNAAKDMMDLLDKGSTNHEELPSYSLFWKNFKEEQFEKITGFGVYGECHSYFDRERSRDNDEDSQYRTLLRIQKQVTDQAIKHTCRALMFATDKKYI